MPNRVIPPEADVGAGLVQKVDLSASPREWADVCLKAGERFDPDQAQRAVLDAGYEITNVAHFLEDFYINHWK